MEDEVVQDAQESSISDTEARLERAVGRYRELLVAANPDAVPELIQGPGIEDLDASLAGAKAAFARARESARAELAASPGTTNPVRRALPPAGLDGAGPLAKIAWGLAQGS